MSRGQRPQATTQTENAQYGGPSIDTLAPLADNPTNLTDAAVGSPNLPVAQPADVVGDATDPALVAKSLKRAPLDVPAPKQYQVVKGGHVTDGPNGRVRIPESKIISSAQYNIENLKKQGIKLKPYDENEGVTDGTE